MPSVGTGADRMARSLAETLADRIVQADDPERARALTTLWSIYRTQERTARLVEWCWQMIRQWYQYLAWLTATLVEAAVELFLERL